MKEAAGRVHFLDEIRGAAILLMVLYHAGYDLVAIFGLEFPFFFSSPLNLARDVMAGTFIFLSGCVCRFSRSNVKRGLFTLLFALVMTGVTYLLIPGQIILFGVLHLLGSSMVLYGLLAKPLDKLRPLWGAVGTGALFYLTFTLPRGVWGGYTYHFQMPHELYEAGFLFPLGFPGKSFFSSDYYPLLPWLLLFLCGTYVGVYIKERRFPPFFYNLHYPPLALVGRHTLVIYLAHQPIIYGALLLLLGRG